MNYKELKNELCAPNQNREKLDDGMNCNGEKLNDSMRNEITTYLKSSFAFPFLFSPALFMSVYGIFAIHNAMLKSTEDKSVMFLGIIGLCVIAIVVFTFMFVSIRKTYLCRHAIRSNNYYVVDGKIDDISIGRFFTIYATINSGNNESVELNFETYYGNEMLEARLKTNEWPRLQFVCTDYGFFTFSDIDGNCTMIVAK